MSAVRINDCSRRVVSNFIIITFPFVGERRSVKTRRLKTQEKLNYLQVLSEGMVGLPLFVVLLKFWWSSRVTVVFGKSVHRKTV